VEAGAEVKAEGDWRKPVSLLELWVLLVMRITRTGSASVLPAKIDDVTMNTASRTHPTSMAVITPPRHTAPLATINLKLRTLAAPISLLHPSIKPIIQQIRTLLHKKAHITRTHSTILQITLQKARTHLMNRPEVHTAIAVLR